jgi:hypothetical protein
MLMGGGYQGSGVRVGDQVIQVGGHKRNHGKAGTVLSVTPRLPDWTVRLVVAFVDGKKRIVLPKQVDVTYRPLVMGFNSMRYDPWRYVL